MADPVLMVCEQGRTCALSVPALGALPLHIVRRVERRWVPESASLCGVGIHGDGCPSVPCAHDYSSAPTQPRVARHRDRNCRTSPH
jgi:hypothetical protein